VGAFGECAAARSGQLFGQCGCPLAMGFGLLVPSRGPKNLGPSPCFG
jgi:hypothetical protein